MRKEIFSIEGKIRRGQVQSEKGKGLSFSLKWGTVDRKEKGNTYSERGERMLIGKFVRKKKKALGSECEWQSRRETIAIISPHNNVFVLAWKVNGHVKILQNKAKLHLTLPSMYTYNLVRI